MQNVTPILIDAKQSKQEREEPSYSFLGMLLRGRLILTLLLTGTIVLCLFWLVFSFLTGW